MGEEREEYNITLGQAIDGLRNGKYTRLEANEPSLIDKYIYYSQRHPFSPYRLSFKETEKDKCAFGLYKMHGVMFKEYKIKEPRLVNWYAPKYVYRKGDLCPQMYKGIFFQSKEEYTKLFPDTIVLGWIEEQLPETYGDCSD